MVHEMSERADSPREGTMEANSRFGIQDGDINIEKLRTFSRSLENITSETLYSKWKRARGEGINGSAQRPRSISLVTPPSISHDEKQQPSNLKPTRKNSFHILQENVFRPRCWTIASPMEVIREHNAMCVFDINKNNDGKNKSTPALKTRKLRRQCRVTFEIPEKQHSPPPSASKMDKEQLLGAKMKPVSEEQREGNRKQEVEKTSETFVEVSQKLRRGSEGRREEEDPPIVARLLSEEEAASTMADSVPRRAISNLLVETVRIKSPQHAASVPSSPNVLMCQQDCEKTWDTIDSANELSRGRNNTVVKGTSEMTANNERSKSLQNTFSLGCTYAVVSQPSRAKENSVNQITNMNSTVITKEQRAELEEEYKKLKKVSLELDRTDFEEGFKSKSYGLSEADKKEISESQPLRRFSELNNPSARIIPSSRPTARAILENITNVAHKTEKQRIQNIEKAFEWIRKELAELRAQDKDIMRTFAKIQAGIRKIKLQRAVSGNLNEPYEYDIVDHSMDLSASFSYVPLVKEFHNTFPRRASLI